MIISKFFEQRGWKLNECRVKICLALFVLTRLRGNVYGCLYAGMGSHAGAWEPEKYLIEKREKSCNSISLSDNLLSFLTQQAFKGQLSKPTQTV